jgi:hypothetical protein
VTAKAEISRLLAVFNGLSEHDKNIVLKISETIRKPETAPAPTLDGNCQILLRREDDTVL